MAFQPRAELLERVRECRLPYAVSAEFDMTGADEVSEGIGPTSAPIALSVPARARHLAAEQCSGIEQANVLLSPTV